MKPKSLFLTLLLATVVPLTGSLQAQDPQPTPTATPVVTPAPLPEAAEAPPAEEPAPSPSPTTEVPAPVVSKNVPSAPIAPQVPATPPTTPTLADPFPGFNVYLPEGQFDIRLRRLIRNVLFEGQVSYNFVDGDISTFLRYKYYARNHTYKIGVFDTLEFESIDNLSGDFDRVRGALVQLEYPSTYDSRYFLLFQGERQFFSDVTNPDNSRDNIYIKLAYQFGTPFDERLNAIVGEQRGRITPVLTAYRDLGSQRLGLAVALTQSFDSAGDYGYTRLETEALKRFDLGTSVFLVSRLHGGAFLNKSPGEFAEVPTDDPDLTAQPTYLFSIPRAEYLRLGGRGALKALDDDSRGTEEVHLSNELFVPVFRNRNFRMGPLHWTNLYGLIYSGVGSVGLDSDEARDLSGYEFGDVVADAGLGFEASADFRDSQIILSLVYAKTLTAPAALESSELRVSVRTVR